MQITTRMAALLALGYLCSAPVRADSAAGQSFTVDKIYQGEGVIWGFDFPGANANEIVFSVRSGKLRYLDVGSGAVQDIAGVPKVAAAGQGGLLDVFFDRKTSQLYLTYSEPLGDGQATTSLYRGKLSADRRTLTGARLFQARAASGTNMHYGGRMAVDAQGYIFLAVGERNDRTRASDLATDHGKILRLNPDGTAPRDNPYVSTPGALPEIWSAGHRNPQGLLIDAEGNLLENEFGPRGGDEVNLIRKGANYGWPVATYGREYSGPVIGAPSAPGTVQPLVHWVPSINPSGMMRYEANALPGFKGNLFIAALSGHLHRIVFGPQWRIAREEKLLENIGQRFRQVRTGPDGLIYVSTDNGAIYRIKPQ